MILAVDTPGQAASSADTMSLSIRQHVLPARKQRNCWSGSEWLGGSDDSAAAFGPSTPRFPTLSCLSFSYTSDIGTATTAYEITATARRRQPPAGLAATLTTPAP